MSNQGEKKGVSALDFFCIGFGAIVGVGWAVSINNWMVNSGGPVPAAVGYLLCLLIMVPFGLVYAELVPMLPVAGGGSAFAYAAFGEKVSFLSGWAAFGAFVAIIPWEAIQITDVLGYLIPGLKVGKLYTIMDFGNLSVHRHHRYDLLHPVVPAEQARPVLRCFPPEDPVRLPGRFRHHRRHRSSGQGRHRQPAASV